MNTPIYKPNYPEWRFIGNFFDMSVYMVPTEPFGESVTVKYGERDGDYASSPVELIQGHILNDVQIGITTKGRSFGMKYRKFLFSEESGDITRAMILGIVCQKVSRT